MKITGFYKSALSRQTAEAVRIRRRGGEGAVLNSKAEINRYYVPRLRSVEEQESAEMEQAEKEQLEALNNELDRSDKSWERSKTVARSRRSNKGI